jgi:hypothetical protein
MTLHLPSTEKEPFARQLPLAYKQMAKHLAEPLSGARLNLQDLHAARAVARGFCC